MYFRNLLLTITALSIISWKAQGQTPVSSSLSINPTLDELVDFALKNKISMQQVYLDEQIGEEEIASSLSGWLPQINANGGYNYYMQIPSNVIDGNVISMGQKHSSSITLQADQSLINPELFLASKSSKLFRESYKQQIEDEKINTVVHVSKSYFDILTTEEQIKIIQENISRLNKQFNDAKARYETGLVDKTDFKRAQISLNNANADLKKAEEQKKYKYDYLKLLIAMDTNTELNLSFEGGELESEIFLDTTQLLSVDSRIEYKQIETLRELQAVNTQYTKWSFLPRLSAFANYQMNFRDNSFSKVYSQNFPSSILGLSLNFPIFQGGKRIHEIRKSKLKEERLNWDLKELENAVETEYSASLTNYKSNVIDWKNALENVDLSKEVYNTIKLQYDAGIKTYLDLMTAETDLRTSQINYLNALYSILASKIDVQKALGNIKFN